MVWDDVLPVDQSGPFCTVCGDEMTWDECYAIDCQDGMVDLYDDDPMMYDEGDTEPCSTCQGDGGWWFCFRAGEHDQQAVRSAKP